MMATYVAPAPDNFLDRLASGVVGSSAINARQERIKETLQAFDAKWKVPASKGQ